MQMAIVNDQLMHYLALTIVFRIRVQHKESVLS